MKNVTITDKLYTYIIKEYEYDKPILLSDIYKTFPDIKKGTLREYMRRFVLEERLFKIKNGVFGLPNPNRILKTPTINSNEAINKKYILNGDGRIIGYRSGFYISNALRLTTQTPSIILIYSNEVSNKMRTIKVQNNKFTINKSRVLVTNENYKLLQILDLLIDFEKYSEIALDYSKKIILDYLKDLSLSKKEIEEIVDLYPKDAQINFYKLGVLNEIAQ